MQINHFLDIRKDTCPLTFVKTKLLAETMHTGQIAEIMLSDGEAIHSLPLALTELGYHVISMKQTDQTYILIFQKQ